MATKRKPTSEPKKSEDAAARADKPERRSVAHKRRWPLIVVLVLLALVVAVVGTFSWDRWLRYDDAAEFSGEWQAHGTTGVVVIDGERIKLTDDVAYVYKLDPTAKTISFTFGNMAGQGRYRFSLDRSQLVITEGEGYSWLSTLLDDIGWMWDQALRAVQGQPQEDVVAGEGVTVLDRLSHDATAAPRSGEALPEPTPEPEPAPEGETTPQPGASSGGDSEPSSGSETTPAPTTAPDSAPEQKPDSPSAPTTPRDLFDVSDRSA